MNKMETNLIESLNNYYNINGYTGKYYTWIDQLVNKNKLTVLRGLKSVKVDYKHLLPTKMVSKVYNALEMVNYLKVFNDQNLLDTSAVDSVVDKIIKSNNPEAIYLCAKLVKNADKQQLQDAIIKTKDYNYIYMFARDISKADIPKLQEAFLDIIKYLPVDKKIPAAYKILRDVPGANADSLIALISKPNESSAEYIYLTALHYAQNVRNTELRKKYVTKLVTGLCENFVWDTDIEWAYLFAKNIRDADINLLQGWIIGFGNIEYMCKFAIDIKGANIERMDEAIAKLLYDLNKVNKYVISFSKLEGAKNVREKLIQLGCLNDNKIYNLINNNIN